MSEILNKDQLSAMSVQELLEMDFGSIALVEGYKPFPTAMYRLEFISAGLETIGDSEIPAIQLKLKVHEALAFENKEQEVAFLESGLAESLPREYTETYYLQKKDGTAAGGTVAAFRTAFDPIAQQVGLSNVNQVLEFINSNAGAMAQAVIKHRKYKDKETGETRESNQIDTIGGIHLLG